MVFVPNVQLSYEAGDFFIGHDKKLREIGVKTDRHAITIAGSRSGKGACVIIPNLRRWPHNALVVDPKGENAVHTWKERQALGSKVYVLDPFETPEIPAELRASFNPLESVDPKSLRAGSDLKVISDGLVKRHDPKHAQWDNGAVSLLAGIMAFVIENAPEDERNLKSVRDILMRDRDDLYEIAQNMKACTGCDSLAVTAGTILMAAIESDKGMEKDYLARAREETEWLTFTAMIPVIEKSTFSLSDLKNGNASVYVVLPPEYLEEHSSFLRLFVRCAINEMAKGGSGKGEKCLFILDEFAALGRIDEVAKSCGLMPSYGVHLWPFLQDLGQLIRIYDRNGAETFFGNSDLHQFFGNTDPLTLQHISDRFGTVTADEVDAPQAPTVPMSTGVSAGRGISLLGGVSKDKYLRGTASVLGGLVGAGEGVVAGARNKAYQDEVQKYQHDMQQAMSQVGKPRMPIDEVASTIQKKDDVIVPLMINFVSGVGPVISNPAAFFRDYQKKRDDKKKKTDEKNALKGGIIITALVSGGIGFWLGGFTGIFKGWMWGGGALLAFMIIGYFLPDD